ncbi:hypothetical protein D3C81_1527760 [compost metagenome]
MLHAGSGQQNRRDADPLQRFQTMAEGKPVDENRRNRVNEGQRPRQRSRQFLNGAVQQHIHHTRVHHAQCHQAGPCARRLRQCRKIRQWREQQHAGADLDQRNQVRWRTRQTLDDQRGNRIEKRCTQCQGNACQVIAAALALAAMGTDDGQHPEKRHAQPGKFLRGDLFVEKQRRQPYQHERLDVINGGADGN